MARRLIVAVVVLVLVAAGGAVWLWRSVHSQSASRVEDVLADYRAKAKPSQPAQPGLPAQGVYTYRVAGHEAISSALTIKRTLPPTATMMVLQHTGGFDTDIRYSKEHREQASYRLDPKGDYLTRAITTVAAGPITAVKDRTWSPELLRFPKAPAAAAAAISGHYTAQSLTLDITTRALPDAVVRVGAKPVTAHVIEFDQKVTGEYQGTTVERYWYDPASGLVVRSTTEQHLTGPTGLDFSVDQPLTSLTPQP
ncbi:MAG: hypothetical protein U0Y82_13350 [Thermoleophilia bacterium]